MDWFDNSHPRPVIDTSYGETGFKKRGDTAGTKGRCKHCGRPTYRYVGSTPVCSYCTSKENDKWPSANRAQ